ncbi:hypothetical protein C8R44DRAFT_618782, partial [Mycena epipterygia]
SLSVEIVPGGIEQWLGEPGPAQPSKDFPFLHTDGHLGVPQKTLYQLYLLALGLLDMKDSQSKSVASQIDASCVILLANPAHYTALNVRKRLIQTGSLSAQVELNFSSRLLLSCRPCSKESILWAHRRWIFSLLYPRSQVESSACGAPPEVPEIPPDAIEGEFQLISRCCDNYPRNYHAWSHHHFVVQCIYTSLRGSDPTASPYLSAFVGEFLKLRRWIETHVSDHSAMHQFCNIVSQLPFDLLQYNSTLGELAQPAAHFEHAISLLTSFPSHESLWMYLRAVISISPAASANMLTASAISLTARLDSPFREKFVLWLGRRDTTISSARQLTVC